MTVFPFFLYIFIFSLENGHSLNTFFTYNIRQIVDEITISPLIRKVKKSRCEPGLFYIGLVWALFGTLFFGKWKLGVVEKWKLE